MLARCPIDSGWYCHTNEAAIVHRDNAFLCDSVLEASAKPGVYVTRDVYCSCCDKIVPANQLVLILGYLGVEMGPYHEVKV
jgi:hypothetical protein